ncbi:MAG: SurA N-terminal domain-containing protein [Bacteroidota bacterium]|nr:SurA N-terminal domain-containing protein [Bacteroidota bacterium]
MATLGSIRRRSTLLILVIGVAMLAFILTDFMQSTRSGGGGGFFIGEVAGEELSIQHFEERVQKGTENWKNSNPNSTLNQSTLAQIRNAIWDEYIKELLMNAEYEALGVDVDSEELFELFQGDNVHSEISKIQIFQDPNTKQFDRAKMLQYMKSLESEQNTEAREEWINFEQYISGLRKNTKYNTLVEKGMYVSAAEAQLHFNQGNENINFEYVPISFVHIADSLVNVTSAEIEDYYDNHIDEYQQDESRDVDYVVFSVVPSTQDDEDTRNNLDAIKTTFESYEDFEIFVKRNSDNSNNTFNFVKEDGIFDTNATSLFNAEKGTVIGPYLFAEGNYRLAKLADVQYRPDSVEARHILISPDENKDLDSVNAAIESIKEEIESGKDFADLAEQHSIDKGSAIKGGDLGWFKEGVMVAEFNEVSFTANKADLTIVQSQFGVHLIEVTKKSRNVKKVRIAFVDRIVEPSSETYNQYYTQAAQFAGALLNTDTTSFDDLATNLNLAKRNQEKVTPSTQNISGLENSRGMIRWMNKAKSGDVSDVFEFSNNYVVALLTKINEEGDAPLEEVRTEIESKVRKQKKGKMITEEINSLNYTSLSDLATAMRSQVQQASETTFLNSQLQNLGNEPTLVGIVSMHEKEVLSNPIVGNNAVFVAKVLSRNEVRTSGDFSKQKEQIVQALKQNASIAAYNAIKENAEVIDNRNNFY